MHYQFTNDSGNAFLTLKPTNDVERALVGVLGHGKAFLHQPDGDDSLVIGFETLFSDDSQPEQPPPAPTPDAPDPGPGWRLIKQGERYPGADWQYYSRGIWKNALSHWGDVTADGTVLARTPIYHNPANLESAGEGYRFCLVSETAGDSTDFWSDMNGRWLGVSNISNKAIHDSDYTYRTNKPLPTT